MSNFKISFVECEPATACSKCAFRLAHPSDNEMHTQCAFDLMDDKQEQIKCRSLKEGGRTDGKNGYFLITQEV